NVGADAGGAEDQGRQAPTREKNTDNHDERNNHRRDADSHEFRRSFRGTEPGSGSEAGEDAEELQAFRTRGVRECRRNLRRIDGRHYSPIQNSANKLKKKQSAHQDSDGHPKMEVGKDALPFAASVRVAFICPHSSSPMY